MTAYPSLSQTTATNGWPANAAENRSELSMRYDPSPRIVVTSPAGWVCARAIAAPHAPDSS